MTVTEVINNKDISAIIYVKMTNASERLFDMTAVGIN